MLFEGLIGAISDAFHFSCTGLFESVDLFAEVGNAHNFIALRAQF